MRTALITIVHGRHEHLAYQQRALRISTVKPSPYVVVAMDDPGAARALSSTASDVRAEIVHVKRSAGALPLASARNHGAWQAIARGAELLVFLDVDCVPDQRLLERYAIAAERCGDALLCGEVGYLPPAPPAGYPASTLRALASPHPSRPSLAEDELRAEPEIDRFWSLSFATTAAAWRRSGGFFGGYVGYGGEDTDFANKAARAGLSMYWVGGAWAFHQDHGVGEPPARHGADIVRNANLFHDRWGRWAMEDWLSELARRGAARFDAHSGRWEPLRSSAVRD